MKKHISSSLARVSRLISVLAFCSALAACGVPYKPALFPGAGGYSSTDINATTVNVNFLTGRTADEGTARDYALYRCAEITLERGYDGFVILKGQANSVPGHYGYTTYANITMHMFKGEPPKELTIGKKYGAVHLAAPLKERLEHRIDR